MSLNDETCMIIRPTLIHLDPVVLNYGSCDVVDDLSMRICILSKTRQMLKNMITRIYEAKTLIKHISCDCKCKFNSATCNSN